MKKEQENTWLGKSLKGVQAGLNLIIKFKQKALLSF